MKVGLADVFYKFKREKVISMSALLICSILFVLFLPSSGEAHTSSPYEILVSDSSGRSGAVPLEGATVSGDMYAFVTPTDGVSGVQFWLDDSQMSGKPEQREKFAPYDFAGTSAGKAKPFDTAILPDGPHSVTARIELSDDHVEYVNAAFTVKNAVPAPEPAPETIRINTGGAAQTVGDAKWQACSSTSDCNGYVSGGFSYSENDQNTGIPQGMNNTIFQSEWTGGQTNGVPAGQTAFTFNIPVENGTYNVKLHFAELNKFSNNLRLFDVEVEGDLKLDDYDVHAEAGGANKAIVEEVPVEVSDGKATIEFVTVKENAKISAIEIAPSDSGSTPPLRDPPAIAPFTWETMAPSPIARYEAQGAAVGGKLYVFGGYINGKIQSTARSDVYDPATDQWKQIADMPVELTHSPAVVNGEAIWLIGGFVDDHPGPSTTDVWKYNTRTNTWSKGPSLPQRRGAGGAAISGRKIHFFGGVDRPAGSNIYIDEDEHWVLDLDDPQKGWQPRSPMPVPRNHLVGAALDGQVYAVGGQFKGDESTGNRPRGTPLRPEHRYLAAGRGPAGAARTHSGG